MSQRDIRIPPRRSLVAKAVQPDYRKWNAVRVGMTGAEVALLLGQPVAVNVSGGRYATYGYIIYPALPHKWAMRFLIGFDENDRVGSKEDPFGGLFSTGREPSKPRLVLPQPGSRYTHYPR